MVWSRSLSSRLRVCNSVLRVKDGSWLAGVGEDWNSCWSQDNIMFCLGDI